MMGTITKNFSYHEFEYSDTARRNNILNAIDSFEIRDNIKALCENVLQPLRDAWGEPMAINSGYRCKRLNELVGGVPNSQHLIGQAADIDCDNPIEMARLLNESGLQFDQCGVANNFCHISHKKNGGNRHQIFYYKSYKGKRL